MNMNSNRADLIFLTVLSLIFCIAGIWMGSLGSWDEAYYAIVSRDMYTSGDWVNLTYFGREFFDKPPLYMWISAAFYHLMGISEFSTRLPSALSGVGCVLMTYLIGRRLFGRITGLAGAGFLLTSTDFLNYCKFGTLDIMAMLLFAGTILSVLYTDSDNRWWVVFWIFSGLSFMLKGPIIVLAWVISFLILLINRQKLPLLNRWFWAGSAAFVLIVLPWHLMAFMSNPDSFWKDFILKHYVQRTTTAVEGHSGNWYFYIRTLINKYHPWIFLTPFGMIYSAYICLKKGEDFRKHAILLAWIGVIFCFFTFLVQTKLKWYVLPMHPALSIISSIPLTLWWFRGGSENLLRLTIVLAAFGQLFFSSVFVQDYAPAIKEVSGIIEQDLGSDDKIALFNYHDEPASVFYFNRATVYTDSIAELDKYEHEFNRIHLMIRPEDYEVHKGKIEARGFRRVLETEGHRENLIYLKFGEKSAG